MPRIGVTSQEMWQNSGNIRPAASFCTLCIASRSELDGAPIHRQGPLTVPGCGKQLCFSSAFPGTG